MNVVLAATAIAATAGSAMAGDALVRRAAAGLFLPGTTQTTSVTYPNQSNPTIETGTFNLEKSTNGGMSYESFLTYCVEVGKPAPPVSAINYAFRPLSDAFTDPEANVLRIVWKNAFALSTMNATCAAAFQAIIWELASDDVFNLSSGLGQNFFVGNADQDVIDKANAWYTNATNGTWTEMSNLTLLRNTDIPPGGTRDYQDLLMEMGGTTLIPLPTAGFMASVGLLGLASIRRRTTDGA